MRSRHGVDLSIPRTGSDNRRPKEASLKPGITWEMNGIVEDFQEWMERPGQRDFERHFVVDVQAEC